MIKNSVLDFLDETTRKYPEKLAIISEENEITFTEFRNKSRILGYELATSTKSFNSPIMVSVDRSEKTLIGFMAALYSGNFYVPVDKDAPLERISYLIETVKPKAFIHFNMDEKIQEVKKEFLEVEFYDYDKIGRASCRERV